MDNRPQSRDRVVQSSALHPSPELEHHDLPSIELCEIFESSYRGSPIVLPNGIVIPGNHTSGDVEFVVVTPEVRSRIKGVLLFIPGAGLPVTPDAYWPDAPAAPLFGATNLWLAKREDEPVLGGGMGAVPVENLAGSIVAGQPIPDPGCLGYIFEVETTANEIWGRLHIDSEHLRSGRWVLKVAADAVYPMTPFEWKRVCSRFARRVVRGDYFIGNGALPPAP